MSRQIITPEQILAGQQDGRHVLLTVFADVRGPAAPYICDAAGAIEHPRQAALASHRMIAVHGQWPEHLPYGQVLEILREAQRLAEAAGWTPAAGIEGVLDTGTVVDDLRVVDDFPAESAAHGYNAAAGFTFEAEQLGLAVVYSDADLDALRRLAQQVYRLLR